MFGLNPFIPRHLAEKSPPPTLTLPVHLPFETVLEMDERGGVVSEISQQIAPDDDNTTYYILPRRHSAFRVDAWTPGWPAERLFESARLDTDGTTRPALPSATDLAGDPGAIGALRLLNGKEIRTLLATPSGSSGDFLRYLTGEAKFTEIWRDNPDLYFIKHDIIAGLRADQKRRWLGLQRVVAGRVADGTYSRAEAKARLALAKVKLAEQYAPLIKSFKDPPFSIFGMVALTTLAPYMLLEPFARYGGTWASSLLGWVPGIYTPGAVLPGGAIAPGPVLDFPDAYVFASYVIGTLIVALWVGGGKDTFKNSWPLMQALKIADGDGMPKALRAIAERVKNYVTGTRVDLEWPKNPTMEQAFYHIAVKYAHLLWHHGFIGVEQALLKDFNFPVKHLTRAKAWMAARDNALFKAVGHALPSDTGELKTYIIDIFALNVPAVMLFSGALKPLAEIMRWAVTDMTAALPVTSGDIFTATASALTAGAIAWTFGCMGNLVITNYYNDTAPPATAGVKAGNARQVFGVLPYLPIMGFLVSNYHWAWQQGFQVAAGLGLLYGVSRYYGGKKNQPTGAGTARFEAAGNPLTH